jgi:hypothetical protein
MSCSIKTLSYILSFQIRIWDREWIMQNAMDGLFCETSVLIFGIDYVTCVLRHVCQSINKKQVSPAISGLKH